MQPTGAKAVREFRVPFAGRMLSLFARPGTEDLDQVRAILRADGDLKLAETVSPSVIFDIGAGIGVAAAYFATVYPKARIYCFEPEPGNLALLRANAALTSPRIQVVPCGLSDHTSELTFRAAMGGLNDDQTLDMTTAGKAMNDMGISRVDVFKIDTRGQETAILRGIPPAARARAQAFVGELHGDCDWEFCDMLAGSHAVEMQKRLGKPGFPFMAVRKDLVVHARGRVAA
ncbi:MAG: FkbM family methyltransferase [Planctomycetota bacterium]|nr:FkbM family methyltransferase [Planctomycetota bacterium]